MNIFNFLRLLTPIIGLFLICSFSYWKFINKQIYLKKCREINISSFEKSHKIFWNIYKDFLFLTTHLPASLPICKNISVIKSIYIASHNIKKTYKIRIDENASLDSILESLINSQSISPKNIEYTLNDITFYKTLNANFSIKGGLEGYFSPATYRIPCNQSLNAMLTKFNNKILSNIFPDLKRKMIIQLKINLHTLLTLASIVEKESSLQYEKKVIAGIIFNRLKIKMKLQMDSSSSYIFQKNIMPLKFQTKQFNEYNTYVNYGIPPGPISSSSVSSIYAILYPIQSTFLYFYSPNLKYHIFCKTYNCHLAAIQKPSLKKCIK
ncbi:MAG: endolytic transglycosylase MltG [Deltaproteobacteria bacterium]|nr:MAG: endolytic transglycosylase MltG [Deltaproteobacteria bacterium]